MTSVSKKLKEIEEWQFLSFSELESVIDCFPPNGELTIKTGSDWRLMCPKEAEKANENIKWLISQVKRLTEALEYISNENNDDGCHYSYARKALEENE